MAAALHISTQRLHRLMSTDEGALPLLQPEAERFDAVERVAMAWQARSAASVRAVADMPMANGQRGLNLRVAEAVTDQHLAAGLDELREMLAAQPRSPNQFLADAGHKRRQERRWPEGLTLCRLLHKELHMATNLAIDPELLERAVEVSGERTKKAAVTKALQEFIARREQRRVAELLGQLEWDPAFDHKAERSRGAP